MNLHAQTHTCKHTTLWQFKHQTSEKGEDISKFCLFNPKLHSPDWPLLLHTPTPLCSHCAVVTVVAVVVVVAVAVLVVAVVAVAEVVIVGDLERNFNVCFSGKTN